MKSTLDRLHSEMDERFTRLQDTDAKFGFRQDINKLCYGEDENELNTNCYTFGEFYRSDGSAQDLYAETLDCPLLFSRRVDRRLSKPEELLKFIMQYGDDTVFPKLCVAIQIKLAVAVSIPSSSKSFSKLELILSYLRATRAHDKLSYVALLSVEREETVKPNFDEMIEQFSLSKARKVLL